MGVNANNKVSDAEIYKILNKYKVVGIPIEELQTYTGEKCYLVKKECDNFTLYIPSNVTALNAKFTEYKVFTEHLKQLHGRIAIVGGSGLENINAMFLQCSFKSIDFSKFDTHGVKDMSYMFNDYRAFDIELNLQDLDTSNVTDMTSMFDYCNVKKINLSGIDTHNVKNMSHMFYCCSSVKEIDVHNIDTSNVKHMSCMFAWCKLKKLDLSSFDTSKVLFMENTFEGAEIDDLNISSFNTENVKSMSQMFDLFKTVGDLNLRHFNVENVTSMQSMFRECNANKLDIYNFSFKNSIKNCKRVKMSNIFKHLSVKEFIEPWHISFWHMKDFSDSMQKINK